MSFPEILDVLNKLAISKIFRKCSIASSVFPPEKVFSCKNDVLFNPRFIEGINVVDRNGCDIFSAPKLPFGGCAYGDVKFIDMVGLGKIRLDLKEMLLNLEIFYFVSAETKKSERKAMAQVTPTETDCVVIIEVDMGDTYDLMVRATIV
ncbi:hypothetical protein Tco_0772722 [Tanacetum coccineum]|uniref:Uncharacterized protein n=1 Tax=Tanacetum coccineum TaxID=301880 RepID=A0ABQ4ZKS7_9ASTR